MSDTNQTGGKAIISIVLLAMIGVAFYLMFTDTWPTIPINDFQANLFDGYYYPKLTFVALFVAQGIIVIPVLFVILFFKWIFKKITKKSSAEEGWPKT